jgi:5-methylthioadenosine/S-adenosylhomocysteine deaminase
VKRLLVGSPWVIVRANRWVRDASVLIEAGRVVEVGDPQELADRHPDAECIDCTGLILLPGFTNCHNHMYEILCRGLGKDAPLEGWLRDTIYPMTRALTEEDYYYGALLGAADCFRNGTTGVVSQLTNFARFHADAEARGFTASGIRARVVRASSTDSTIDPDENGEPEAELTEAAAFLERWSDGDRVRGSLGPAGLFSCDPAAQAKLKELASERGSKYFTHLDETRHQHESARANGYEGQVDWAHQIGILDVDTVVAHAVWSSPREIDLLAETSTTVVHNPSSNMVLGSGIAPIPSMLDAGVHVTVATDGPASNDSQDMFAEMKAAALLQRVGALDPTIVDADTVFRMATEAGSRVFDLAGSIGRIEPGYLADITAVRVGGNPALQPVFDPIASLVYCGSGRDVAFTIIEGEFVYRDGVFPTIDLDEVVGYIQTETQPRVQRALQLN